MEGDTSSFECAHQLGKLCENRRLVVNLIPYNQTDVKDKLRCPSKAHLEKFQQIVSSYGVFVTTRKTMGADIASACGQLVVKKEQDEAKHKNVPGTVIDIEDVGVGDTTTTRRGVTPRSTKKREGGAHKIGDDTTTMTSTSTSKDNDKAGSSNDSGLDDYVKPLVYATSVAATCFVVSSVLFVLQRRRR